MSQERKRPTIEEMRGIFPPDPDEPRRPSRHEIALEAMKAAITGFGPMFVMGDLSPTAIATEAYELADAMLAAGNDAEPLCPNCHGHTVSHNGVPILCEDCQESSDIATAAQENPQ